MGVKGESQSEYEGLVFYDEEEGSVGGGKCGEHPKRA